MPNQSASCKLNSTRETLLHGRAEGGLTMPLAFGRIRHGTLRSLCRCLFEGFRISKLRFDFQAPLRNVALNEIILDRSLPKENGQNIHLMQSDFFLGH